ncbi:putative DNA ligase [Catellatospora methionotrophica]|uniref:DNA ligase n=1 Tax=Catellatospora methionotrophica TaxID=121620 RepID=A0A8J3PF14_9ACTN|nr:ATP-dependent DNA ligase [Catellatospora methionotrophica]GIG12731.1 putative DNA ligase [Catellatospora methionotrophica]
MLFAGIAATSAAVTATSGRKAKVELLAAALRELAAGGDPVEIAAGAAYLSGELRQRQIGVGWASLRELPPPADAATLDIRTVDAALESIGLISGQGSQARRRDAVGALFGAATADEQLLLSGLIRGELRQGAQAGLLADAVALATGVPAAVVRRALLLSGDLKAVATTALTEGEAGLSALRLSVGTALAPMLAQSAPDPAQALVATGVPAAVDAKLDGIRIQAHRDGDEVAVFSRSLDDITARVPEIVAAVRALPVRTVVLDGEAIAVDERGRPRPFQETSGRAAQRASGALTSYFFDLLHLDGTDWIDEPGTARWAALDAMLPAAMRVERTFAETPEQAQDAFAAALAAGHEGVVVKAAQAAYEVGRRGAGWVKVKPRHTLDLVILAAEWGNGRRRGWLSNLHLGARAADGGFVMLGKTFKGLTDAMLTWQTERLLELAVQRDDFQVTVRPELVVEIAFDGVQRSTRYPGGVTLRFARVLGYREDKSAAEADTLDAVRAIGAALSGEDS